MAIFMAMFFAATVHAQDAAKKDQPAAAATKAPEVKAKVCPVCGRTASDSVSTEYKGKTYNFCCENCKKDFLKSPEKYIKAEPTPAPAPVK